MPPYLIIAGIVLTPVACLILAGLLSAYLNPPEWKKQSAAHAEALTYLGDVIRSCADRAPNPSLVRSRVATVLEVLEYPGRGNVVDWEGKLAAMLYDTEEEPSDPWEMILTAYFEFARENLYCGFVKQDNLAAYECVRACLARVGVQAKPVGELALGRL